MAKVSIIGKGKWGTKIFDSIKNDVDIVKPENSDWVVISTPNDLHFEQVEYWLEQKKNVFCEKPLSLNYKSAEYLYNTAFDNDVKLYVDDVFIWRNEFYNVSNFRWGKTDTTNYIDRLAYHHFYLWVRNKKILVDEIIKTNDYSFTIKLNGGEIGNFDYTPSEKTFHSIDDVEVSNTNDNPLKKMLIAVFEDYTAKSFNKDVTMNATYLSEEVRKVMYPKALVVGGGIFGSTAAVSLANNGYDVEIHEKQSDIMMCASNINQYRLHKGYHYPRSSDTALECNKGLKTFKRKYEQSVLNGSIEHYYCIASEDSLISSDEYLEFLDEHRLNYKIVDSIKNTDLTVKVEEELFDSQVLRQSVKKKLFANNINIKINHESDKKSFNLYDVIIFATYSNIKLSDRYKNKSIVVMDGPFMCLDPYGTTDYHVLGNVVHAIHETNIGTAPIIKNKKLSNYINKGIIYQPDITNIDKFIETGERFFDDFSNLEHIGSMFTVRAVLKDREHDDARPTLVEKHGDNMFTLFSGKIDTCVDASNELIKMIGD